MRFTHWTRYRYEYIMTTLLAALFIVAACNSRDPAETVREPEVYVDPGTGCQYLRPKGIGSYTPRLNIEGHPMCGTVIEKKKVQKDT